MIRSDTIHWHIHQDGSSNGDGVSNDIKNELHIHQIPNQNTYNLMQAAGEIYDDHIYLVDGEDVTIEKNTNKTQTININSTTEQYPSARAVYLKVAGEVNHIKENYYDINESKEAMRNFTNSNYVTIPANNWKDGLLSNILTEADYDPNDGYSDFNDFINNIKYLENTAKGMRLRLYDCDIQPYSNELLRLNVTDEFGTTAQVYSVSPVWHTFTSTFTLPKKQEHLAFRFYGGMGKWMRQPYDITNVKIYKANDADKVNLISDDIVDGNWWMPNAAIYPNDKIGVAFEDGKKFLHVFLQETNTGSNVVSGFMNLSDPSGFAADTYTIEFDMRTSASLLCNTISFPGIRDTSYTLIQSFDTGIRGYAQKINELTFVTNSKPTENILLQVGSVYGRNGSIITLRDKEFPITQTTGDNDSVVMSQKAVTDEFTKTRKGFNAALNEYYNVSEIKKHYYDKDYIDSNYYNNDSIDTKLEENKSNVSATIENGVLVLKNINAYTYTDGREVAF